MHVACLMKGDGSNLPVGAQGKRKRKVFFSSFTSGIPFKLNVNP